MHMRSRGRHNTHRDGGGQLHQRHAIHYRHQIKIAVRLQENQRGVLALAILRGMQLIYVAILAQHNDFHIQRKTKQRLTASRRGSKTNRRG
jgi:hypothetical protein